MKSRLSRLEKAAERLRTKDKAAPIFRAVYAGEPVTESEGVRIVYYKTRYGENNENTTA